MRNFRSLVLGLVLVSLAGCETLSTGAESVQVHRQYSGLLRNCTQLGPLQVEVTKGFGMSFDAAVAEARLRTSNMGGDNLVITNYEYADSIGGVVASTRLQGVAYSCWSQKSKSQAPKARPNLTDDQINKLLQSDNPLLESTY